ncbi:MAG: hypothetical protein ACP5GZ_11740 [Vulcanisaeta sp.]|uniref:hypothetical protein n=1 Tax=Vulcanisaeta sp. TaxID=2020871 RepID=UPI003D0F9570
MVGIYSVIRYAMLFSSYIKLGLGYITIDIIYLIHGLLMIKSMGNRNYAELPCPL